MSQPHLLITPGEPAGIGPDVVIQAAQKPWNASITAIADPAVMSERAKILGLPLIITECDLQERHTHKPGTLAIHPIHFQPKVTVGALNSEHAATIIESLTLATTACLQGKADAIVTGPINKESINDAGIAFSGHTEFLANICGVSQTVMLFVVDQLKAAIVTTHLPLQEVAAALTPEKLANVIHILHRGLQQYFHLDHPRILIAGLNPHAGEGGYLGREEIDVMQPVLTQLRQNGWELIGPMPADTLMTTEVLKQGDAILGMYHDQILPTIKHIGFDRAVNMTLGLPIIRTSVDHGTALNIAGSGKANDGSLCAAIKLAISVQPSSND